MKHKAYLQQMGVPLWRLRQVEASAPVQHKAEPQTVMEDASIPANEALPQVAESVWQGLQVDMAHGAPGQQLLDECLQAVRMMGVELEVKYCPQGPAGLRLAGRELPSMGELLAEPQRKQILWQALLEWLDEQGATR